MWSHLAAAPLAADEEMAAETIGAGSSGLLVTNCSTNLPRR
jgi:hypothetical protein